MMRKTFLILLIMLFVSSCSAQDRSVQEDASNDDNDSSEASNEGFIPSIPIVEFDQETLDNKGLMFSGSEAEIAQSIYDWQTENMSYVAYGPVSDAMRWNYMLPGIVTTLEMLDNTNSEGKIEGLCYNFATIYCSIAKANGLDCRVTQMKEKPSQLDSSIDPNTTTGLGPDEYDRLNQVLEAKGYDFDYELIRSIAKETSAHYRAEVMIENEWKVYDASTYFVGDEYNKNYDFYEVDWFEGFEEDKVNN